uniref:Bm4893 n=2 Tax=Brugia malayi TaxID=6279 RepID=A0A1I9GCK7_BRUMA|nr:Bm4893 [Brugia malayi]
MVVEKVIRKMVGEFNKRGSGIHKSFNSPRGGSTSRGGSRGRFSTRGGGRGGISPREGGDRSDLSNRARGPRKGVGRGGRGGWGDRGGRGSWGGRGRNGRGRSDQGRKGFSTKNERDMDFKKRMSFDMDNRSEKSGGKKNENKYKKSMSEPSTPSTVKFKKYEMNSEHDEDEVMSTSDIEDQEITPKTPKKIADMTSKQEKTLTSKSYSELVQIMSSAKGLSKKKGVLKRENGKEEDEELVVSRDVKKAKIINVESDKDNGEGSDYNEDEEESSDEGSEGEVVKKNVNGVAETSESDEDEDESLEDEDEDESLEDEDEEETPSDVKPTLSSTPGNTVPLKSALKTPCTGKSSKKVSLSAITTTTPEILLKNKTPATPHPQTMSSKNKRRLKFEESDESDGDEEDDDEKDEGRFKLDNREMKLVENDDSEDEESNENEGKDDTKRTELAKTKREGTVEAVKNKKDKINLKKFHNKNDKGTEEKLASQKQPKAIANKDEMKGVKRKYEDEPLLKPEDAKEVIKEEQKRRDERDKKSLFVRGLPKDVKLGQLKALHNDILYVRHMPHRNFAWLIFASEKLCEKAYEDISKQTVEGRTLTVDFCGSKAKTRPQKDKSQLPINPLELFVGGLPPSTSKDQMKVIFRQATNISFPKQARNKNKLYCFVQFGDEKEARAAFEKGKTLKISGVPVDVLYARIRKGITDEAKLPKTNQAFNLSNGAATKSKIKNSPKINETNGDTTSEGIESSDEGIEEVDDYSSVSKPKKAKLAKASNSKILHEIESLKQKNIETKCATVPMKSILKSSTGKISEQGKANLESKLVFDEDDKDNNIGDDDDDDSDNDNIDDGDDTDDNDEEEEQDDDDDEEEEEEDDDDEEDGGNMEDSDGSN